MEDQQRGCGGCKDGWAGGAQAYKVGGALGGDHQTPVRLGAPERYLQRCKYDGAELLLFRADGITGAMGACWGLGSESWP